MGSYFIKQNTIKQEKDTITRSKEKLSCNSKRGGKCFGSRLLRSKEESSRSKISITHQEEKKSRSDYRGKRVQQNLFKEKEDGGRTYPMSLKKVQDNERGLQKRLRKYYKVLDIVSGLENYIIMNPIQFKRIIVLFYGVNLL